MNLLEPSSDPTRRITDKEEVEVQRAPLGRWHDEHVPEYSWPADPYPDGEKHIRSWPETIAMLPLGAQVTGDVIARLPFGVFIRIDSMPDALGLAEITTAPCRTVLPTVGTRVAAMVIWHAEQNHQVKLKLTEWAQEGS
ncbi:hypothetical protein [Streptacidiphilus griseoplanus]|uniref:hypothetical protein n=1 Tax=Peterkaempfera griseoplana TaxID=66896 RepID=UPI001C379421|nr:hypothetical protein [Peterkaempfera griseoplana]